MNKAFVNNTLVIIPTYNERENLQSISERVLAQENTQLLIVDDASPDGTGQLADELASANPSIHVLHREGKKGLGTAYCEGFEWGLAHGFQILVELDGDGSHQPEQLDRLREQLEHADLAIGSRWIPGGSVVNWPARRRLLSRAGSFYARAALGLPFQDITGGYRAFTASALRRLDLGSVASQGYCFQIDMLRRANAAGLRIAEVPITFVEREFGESKMSKGIVSEALIRVTEWGMQSLQERIVASRLWQLFVQIALFCLVGGIGFVVDVGVFNALRLGVFAPHNVSGGPMLAKLVSTSLAIAVTWAGNRYWTFRDQRREDVRREAVEYAVASVAGVVVSIACLWATHYLLGLTSVLDDNLSANVVGLALGTLVRFVLYRSWVFARPREAKLGSVATQKIDSGLQLQNAGLGDRRAANAPAQFGMNVPVGLPGSSGPQGNQAVEQAPLFLEGPVQRL